MNIVASILSIIGLVYACSIANILITSSDECAANIGRMLVPILFQNGWEKRMLEGHEGSIDNGNWHFIVKQSISPYHGRDMLIDQTIHVTGTEAPFPVYQVLHRALYAPQPVMPGMCKPPGFSLKECQIEVSALSIGSLN